MFFRRKLSGRTEYLQIVKNERVEGKPRQSVVATLGRVEEHYRHARERHPDQGGSHTMMTELNHARMAASVSCNDKTAGSFCRRFAR